IGVVLIGAQGSASSTGPQQFTQHLFRLTATPARRAFVNNADDRARGTRNNPFGNYRTTQISIDERRAGPFPGDEAVFTYTAAPPRDAPSALLECQSGFAKEALCQGVLRLRSGTLSLPGTLPATAPAFTFAVVGGTGSFRGATGSITATRTSSA